MTPVIRMGLARDSMQRRDRARMRWPLDSSTARLRSSDGAGAHEGGVADAGPGRRTHGRRVDHHVASMYPVEIQLAQALAAGKPMPA